MDCTEGSERLHRASDYCARAKRIAAVTAATATALVGIVVGSPGGVLDPLACLSAAYVTGLFFIQVQLLEWPHADLGMALLLFLAAAVFLAPTLASACDCWHSPLLRVTSAAANVLLAVAAYRYMVRGPACRLAPGSLSGRVCIVTGCNTGIGIETAEALGLAGAVIVFACRSEHKAEAAMARLCRAGVAREQLHFIALDLASLQSVRRFVEAFQKLKLSLHLLILNAGAMFRSRALSEDGLELTLASNHLGHFLLTLLLLPCLLETEARGEEPRIVAVGSVLCYQDDAFDFREVQRIKAPYELFHAYAQSKLANVLFARELARRLRQRGSKIPANVVHPGQVLTEVMRDFHPAIVFLTSLSMRYLRPLMHLMFKTCEQGSSCTLHVATSAELCTSEAASGEFFIRHAPAQLSSAASDSKAAARLWELSEKLTGAPVM